MFTYAVEAAAVHAKLYMLALEAAEQGKDLDITEIYLCPVCGYLDLVNKQKIVRSAEHW